MRRAKFPRMSCCALVSVIQSTPGVAAMINEPVTIALLALILAVSGVVKGVSGTGLPLVGIPLMTLVVPMPLAVSLIAVSLVTTNLMQAATSRALKPALRGYWPLMLTLPIGTFLGAYLLAHAQPGLVERFTGVVVVCFVLYMLLGGRVSIAPSLRLAVFLVAGVLAGIIGGMTAIFAPPLLLLLLSTREPKEMFVAILALSYIVAGTALTLSLAGFSVMTGPILLWSIAAVLPVTLGQLLGNRLRQYVSEVMFQRVIQIILLLAGLKLILG